SSSFGVPAMSVTKWPVGSVAALAVVFIASTAHAEDKVIKPGKEWKGTFPEAKDEPLMREAPRTGDVTHPDAGAKLCKAWGIEKVRQEVDFKKQIVLVSVAGGAANTWQDTGLKLSDKGDLVVTNSVTQRGSAGFIYLIQVVDRDGIKSVNGKALAAQKKPGD